MVIASPNEPRMRNDSEAAGLQRVYIKFLPLYQVSKKCVYPLIYGSRSNVRRKKD